MDNPRQPGGLIVGIVRTFLSGPLSPLVIVFAAALGLTAVLVTPREEEPQIVVPMADIAVDFPGRSAEEVEQLVVTPLERLLWQIDGVEHVYSTSRREHGFVTVRFFVGWDRERAMVNLRDKIEANRDTVPPGVAGWIVKPVEIDDVPIVTLTLTSAERDGHDLRRMAEEMKARLAGVENLSRTEVFGGYRREITIRADVEDMAGRGISLQDVLAALQRSNVTADVGTVYEDGRTARVIVGPLLKSVADVRQVVISGPEQRIVRLEDVAVVTDGPEEPTEYVHTGFGPAFDGDPDLRGRRLPAVTMAFSKKKGTNAVRVASEVLRAAEELRKDLLPPDVQMRVTRDYGRVADDKVNGLISSMIFAVLTVVGLITLTMGWREGMVVGMAVPVSFALALFVNFLFGYTINRVTLFALILSLGLVVDDPITNVDNIQRHIRMRVRRPFDATLSAVHEVIPPVIMSTLTIIVSFLPMFFITGMMGPYMGPMAINVPLAVSFSTVCALTFVPWLSHRLLRGYGRPEAHADAAAGAAAGAAEGATEETGAPVSPVDVTPRWVRRLYRGLVSPLLRPRGAFILLGAVVVLLGASVALMGLRKVPLKMLPFDNKNEFQLILEMPEGTTQERTDAVVQELERYLETVNEVVDFQSYVGVNAPIDFNGLVRHYGLRRGGHQADVRINLVDKSMRRQQSHAIALRVRDALTALVPEGAVLSIVEVPPGPPVISTLTVEVSGRPDQSYDELIAGAAALRERLVEEDPRHIVQVDDMSEAAHDRLTFVVDRDKAAYHGLSVAAVVDALSVALNGRVGGVVHADREREPLLARVRLPVGDRMLPDRLGQLWLRGAGGMVQLAELGEFVVQTEDQPIYHKDLERVVFVTAECVGRPPGEIVWDTRKRIAREPLPAGITDEWAGEGEWQITVRVFRDLGIAFGAALLGIYVLMTVQMRSFSMPLIVMMAIPLTIIGIAPGFWLLNVVAGGTVGRYADPVFFTATAMIGMIALGGIVIRNSIVLIEFIQSALAEGKDIREAILESGAVRFRPIVLTAGTTMLGAWPITLDPVFSGLAWALIFGLLASTLFTLLVVPAVYMLVGPRTVAKTAG